ncbi:MAG: RNA polymerase sigma factor [bacterium]|nr:RNA polymerase sigma factor [bacterium]
MPIQDPYAEHVRKVQNGDRSAFEAIYIAYRRRLLSLVFRLVGNSEDADEIVQETFLEAYKNIRKFQGRSIFYTWLYRISMNISIQYNNRVIRRSDPKHYKWFSQPTVPALDMYKDIENRFVVDVVKKEIDSLPPNYRRAIDLVAIQGRSYEQTSVILGITPMVLKGRMHRARLVMRKSLEEKYPGITDSLFPSRPKREKPV